MIGTGGGRLIVSIIRGLTGARAAWRAGLSPGEQYVFFGNHTSHVDFLFIWSVLPAQLRARTRAVAAADYWLAGPIRRYIARKLLEAVLIDRNSETRKRDPIEVLCEAVDHGHSLIVFPEGTRNMTDERLLPLKSGIFRLGVARPKLCFVPVWLDNVSRVMPKGVILPLPLLCTASFGAPIRIEAGEEKDAFLERARAAMLTLDPERSE